MGFVCFYLEGQVKTDTTELRLLLKRCTYYLSHEAVDEIIAIPLFHLQLGGFVLRC